MKRIGWLIVLFSMLALLSSQSQAARDQRGSEMVNGNVLIKFTPDSSSAQQAAMVGALGGEIFDRIPQIGYVAARFPALADRNRPDQAAQLLSTLAAHPLVEVAEPSVRLRAYDLDDPQPPAPDAPRANADTQAYLPLVGAQPFPNDQYLTNQYAWRIIQAYDGWDYGQGSPNVVVAVLDTGIQLDHPDLVGKLVAGYDFIENDSTPSDEHGHGTHVAGTVAASTNNMVGVAGTCPQCKLMPVRVLDGAGFGDDLGVAHAIVYAADQGVEVINLSLGSDVPNSALKDAVTYAWNKGVLLVCAAGNSGDQTLNYPAYYEPCLAVGATDYFDLPAYYSTYGTWVDLAAPGSEIFSTGRAGGYYASSGTSMATPHVAGVAGLLAAKGLNNWQIRTRLQTSADPIDYTGEYWSNGRLNMLRALRGY